MLTVACVLKNGPEYTPAHVAALRDGVARHLTIPHRFVCLTDMPVDCESIALQYGWPGWWSKLELFEQFRGPTLYFDLDTIIVGPLDDIVLGHRFTMLRAFKRRNKFGSGMMAWDRDMSELTNTFKRAAQDYQDEYCTPKKLGDQSFILNHLPVPPDSWQTLHPGKVVSYKLHCRKGLPRKSKAPGTIAIVPAGASVVCYHAKPRPWTTPLWRDADGPA